MKLMTAMLSFNEDCSRNMSDKYETVLTKISETVEYYFYRMRDLLLEKAKCIP